ncbi:MAG: hemerythrin domain-containing protein [Pseudoxanthomonas sp.]|nr:hemerythrin domain-containing protein [Pseudoxanthomonas sp.]
MSQVIPLSSLKASPTASFEQPFEMLAACHERVIRMLALLARLREHLRQHGGLPQADPARQARQAAQDVMRYFDQAAPQHHRDEEMHVFPALISQGDPATLALVTRLQQDHLQMESRWVPARNVLAAVAQGQLTLLGQDDEAALDAFASPYAGHIEAEESIAYPAARALLDTGALAMMGREMMHRRGLTD